MLMGLDGWIREMAGLVNPSRKKSLAPTSSAADFYGLRGSVSFRSRSFIAKKEKFEIWTRVKGWIVNYLCSHFSPKRSSRRSNIGFNPQPPKRETKQVLQELTRARICQVIAKSSGLEPCNHLGLGVSKNRAKIGLDPRNHLGPRFSKWNKSGWKS